MARNPILLIDLHSDSAQSIPYAIIDRPVALGGGARVEMDATLLAYAGATGLTVLQEYPDDQYNRFSLDASLAGAMVNLASVPAVTVECGPRRFVDLEAVQVMFDAVRGLLAHAGLVSSGVDAHSSCIGGGPWRRAPSPRTRRAGLFSPAIQVGTVLGRGDVIGHVTSVAGEEVEELRSLEKAVVISWMVGTWVAAGGVVGTFGVVDR
jgi:predicted deacylase